MSYRAENSLAKYLSFFLPFSQNSYLISIIKDALPERKPKSHEMKLNRDENLQIWEFPLFHISHIACSSFSVCLDVLKVQFVVAQERANENWLILSPRIFLFFLSKCQHLTPLNTPTCKITVRQWKFNFLMFYIVAEEVRVVSAVSLCAYSVLLNS